MKVILLDQFLLFSTTEALPALMLNKKLSRTDVAPAERSCPLAPIHFFPVATAEDRIESGNLI